MPQPSDERLAQLGFQLLAPNPRLRPYVRSYWYFRREAELNVYQEEYMHPQGGFGLAFNFGDVVSLDAQPIIAPVFLDGANTISRKLGFLGHVELLGVRFHEGGAYPFLGIPLNELRNELGVLEAMNRLELLRLHTQLYEAPSLAARIRLLEAWLTERLRLGKERDALIPASLAILRKEPLPISELAERFYISQRQLERLYQRQVGLSPKHYSQLLRVEAARLALKNTKAQSTAQLAAELGFYDQSHFIREFSAVIGLTPTAYQKRRR